METRKFKTGQTVWLFDEDNCQKETIVDFDENIQEYELSDGNFYTEKEIYRTKKEAQLETHSN